MVTFWRIINLLILASIVLVILFSERITVNINNYRDYLNEQETLNDGMHLIRLLVNKWEGIALACTLCFLFLIRFLAAGLSGIFKKLTSKN